MFRHVWLEHTIIIHSIVNNASQVNSKKCWPRFLDHWSCKDAWHDNPYPLHRSNPGIKLQFFFILWFHTEAIRIDCLYPMFVAERFRLSPCSSVTHPNLDKYVFCFLSDMFLNHWQAALAVIQGPLRKVLECSWTLGEWNCGPIRGCSWDSLCFTKIGVDFTKQNLVAYNFYMGWIYSEQRRLNPPENSAGQTEQTCLSNPTDLVVIVFWVLLVFTFRIFHQM